MSQISANRVARLAHLVIDGLRDTGLGGFPNPAAALRETKSVLDQYFNREPAVDEIVRQKIQSLSRGVPPGSREWDVLYRKYREEELQKHKKKP